MLSSGNCSGCGACVLTGAAHHMSLDAHGQLRPEVREDAGAGGRFGSPGLADFCPALVVHRPPAHSDAHVDPDFGRHLGIWAAHSTDPAVRWAGSSGGALTALVAYLLDSGEAAGAALAGPEAGSTRSRAFVARTGAEALAGASSRYAPVSTLEVLAGEQQLRDLVVVAKPCEASALRALAGAGDDAPTILSFFCAGVPSQEATDDLLRALGADPDGVQTLRYRGNGWPGSFAATDSEGRSFQASYERSWGGALGRRIQARCKVCVDGVGESADVVAGDLWDADANGYPLFSEAPGRSIMIARTPRGQALVEAAVRAGALAVEPTDLHLTRSVQTLQVSRRRYLLGRLLGRRLAGRTVPRFVGFALWRSALRDPVGTLRQARGSYSRARHR